ncbi:MAG TPA: hypothetical protein VF266_08560 [Thermoanaerobaculia bacterium]
MRFFAVLLLLSATLVSAQPTYTTGFEDFALGDVQGQQGWGYLSNSPTGATVVSAPVHGGARSLRLFTRNADFFGVASSVFSATIDPPAGEAGSTVDGVVVPDPETHFSASLWYRTPDVPVISTRTRLAELNPSSKGPDSDDPTKRYAQVRIDNNEADGRVRVEIGWYTNGSSAASFQVAEVAVLDWGAWYRFDYLIHFVDGLNGTAPNDRFSLTVFDANGVQLGTACGSTWETAWKADPTFGGGLAAQAVNGFDFWSQTGPTGTVVGHIDDFTISSFSAVPFAVAISGETSVCPGATTLLSSSITASTYAWRNAANEVVATTPSFNAPAGTYTLTVTNTLCETATSAPFTVTAQPAPQVTITGRGYVIDAADRDLLTAQVTGAPTSYTWRNAANEIVGTGPTFSAPAGTYTVTITDTCGPVTSAPFSVTLLATPTVPTVGEWGLLAMMVTLAALALLRMR